MRIPMRLNAIEQEHLQELYDAAGVSRDELPYTEQFEKLWQDFQDRAFKNADREQVFGALVRYVRSSSCAAGKTELIALSEEQASRIKDVVRRHGKGERLMPYSSEFDAALTDFMALTKSTLSPRDFWLAICQAQGRPRRGARQATPSSLTPSSLKQGSKGEGRPEGKQMAEKGEPPATKVAAPPSADAPQPPAEAQEKKSPPTMIGGH